jgi:hypothetical protein
MVPNKVCAVENHSQQRIPGIAGLLHHEIQKFQSSCHAKRVVDGFAQKPEVIP